MARRMGKIIHDEGNETQILPFSVVLCLLPIRYQEDGKKRLSLAWSGINS